MSPTAVMLWHRRLRRTLVLLAFMATDKFSFKTNTYPFIATSLKPLTKNKAYISVALQTNIGCCI